MRIIVPALAFLFVSVPPAYADDPSAAVSTVINLSRRNRTAFFYDKKPSTAMRRYISQGLNAAWTRAYAKHPDEPLMDGEFVSGYQGVTSMKIGRINTTTVEGMAANVVAQIMVTVEGKPKTMGVRFRLANENGLWKVDDVENKAVPSLRRYLDSN